MIIEYDPVVGAVRDDNGPYVQVKRKDNYANLQTCTISVTEGKVKYVDDVNGVQVIFTSSDESRGFSMIPQDGHHYARNDHANRYVEYNISGVQSRIRSFIYRISIDGVE
jgi:hypothetical protein